LVIADLDGPNPPTIRGELVLDDFIRAIGIEGDTAYLYIDRIGVVVVDILSSEEMTKLGEVSLDTWSGYPDLAVHQSHVYASNQHNHVAIIDASDPRNPVIVGSLDEGGEYGIEIDESHLLILGGGQLTKYSLSDPVHPAVQAQTAASGFDLAFDWPFAFVTSGGSIRVFEIIVSSWIIERDSIELLTGPSSGLRLIDVTNEIAAVSGVEEGAPILFVLDLSLPDPTTGAVRVQPFEGAMAMSLGAEGLFHAYDLNGLSMTDITTPSNPVPVVEIPTPSAVHQIVTRGGFALAQSGFAESPIVGPLSTVLQNIDVTDPTAPLFLDSLALGELGVRSDLLLERDLVYIPDPFTIVDASDPQQLDPLSSSQDRLLGISKRGPFIYSAVDTPIVFIIDVTDPLNPVHLNGPLTLTFNTQDVFLTHDHGYTVGWDNSWNGAFAVFDFSGPFGYTVLSSIEIPIQPLEVVVSGPQAFVRSDYGGPLIEVDVGNPLAPTFTLTGFFGDRFGDLVISGDVLYNTFRNTIQAIDIRTPGQPVLLCEQSIPGEASGVSVAGGGLYVTQGPAGFSIYRQYGGALFLDGFEVGTAENWASWN
jgi:hypothetical protein